MEEAGAEAEVVVDVVGEETEVVVDVVGEATRRWMMWWAR